MGCCSTHKADFLAAENCSDLSTMMMKEKESIRTHISGASIGDEEKVAFYSRVCEDIDVFSPQVKDADLKGNKFEDTKKHVNSLFLAINKYDKVLYNNEKIKFDHFLRENVVLVCFNIRPNTEKSFKLSKLLFKMSEKLNIIYSSLEDQEKSARSKKVRLLLMNGLDTHKSFFPSLPRNLKSKRFKTISGQTTKLKVEIKEKTVRDEYSKVSNYISTAVSRSSDTKNSTSYGTPNSKRNLSVTITSSFKKNLNKEHKLPGLTFQNKYLQDFISNHISNSTDQSLKVYNFPPDNPSSILNEIDRKSIKLNKKEITLHSSKPSIAEDIQSKLKYYINKKIHLHSNSNGLASTIVRVKKLSPHPTAFNYKLENETEGKINQRPISVRESSKDLSSRFLVQNLKKSIPVFTKLVVN